MPDSATTTDSEHIPAMLLLVIMLLVLSRLLLKHLKECFPTNETAVQMNILVGAHHCRCDTDDYW